MKKIVRFGIAIPEALIEHFDRVIASKGYPSRSEAVRDLIRDSLAEESIAHNKTVLGTVTLIYNHETRELSDKLTDVQHHHNHEIIASTHVHLDRRHCAEVIIMRGKSGHIKKLADKLTSTRGVLQGKLVLVTAEER